MVDRLLDRSRLVQAGIAAAVLGSVFLSLLPLGGVPGRPGPDAVLCLLAATVMRRPDLVPAPMVAILVFLEDLLTMRPPGLWAALTLAGTEVLRDRAQSSRDLGFWAEWLLVAIVFAGMFATGRIALGLLMVTQPPISDIAAEALVTMLFYPLVVLVLRAIFGLRKPASGEVDDRGRRL